MFKEILKSKRIDKDYSFRELAEKTKVSPTYLWQMESGTRKPMLDIYRLQCLAMALGMNINEMDRFIDYAYIENGRLPRWITKNEKALSVLPVILASKNVDYLYKMHDAIKGCMNERV